jgi:multidrug efflux pump subunit AcrB
VRTQKQVEEAIRKAIAPIPGIDVSVGFNRPIYVAVLGSDPEGLARVAADFAAQVRKIRGIADVELSVKPGLPAYAVRLKDDAVRELGLTAPQLASSLRAYVSGEVATTWTTPDGEQVEVLLRLPEAQRQRVEQMRDLPVAFARDGTPIALASVATITEVANPEVIRRQDLQRREAIFAGVEGRPAGEVGEEVQKLTETFPLPPGYRFDVGGQTKEQQEAFGAMLGAMVLAVVFIYIVLASQFGSFVQPLAIMASLPLALIGVMLALLLWRTTLNLFSMIGLVMLMGLVTKNAILLVDFANQARRAGASVPEALRQAGLIRMRPIVMTTAAMVFGMLPLALALNDGGEIQAPMGRAIIGGVLTSTLLTLVVVPVIYSYLVRERRAPAALPAGGGPLPMPADRN